MLREEGDWEPTGIYWIQSSVDGLEWSSLEVSIPDIANASSISSVCHADGVWFVKISDKVYKSVNGNDWDEQSIELPDDATAPNRWLFGNGWHVNAVPAFYGVATSDAPVKLRSRDGLRWIRVDQDFDDALTQAFGSGKFVALSDTTRYTSVDGELWETAPTSGLADYPEKLTYHRGRWLCTVSQANIHALLISDDAANWQTVYSGDQRIELSGHDSLGVVIIALQEVVWPGGYVAAHLYSSEDGFRWRYLGPRPGTNFLGSTDVVTLGNKLHNLRTGGTSSSLQAAGPVRLRVPVPGALESPVASGFEYRAEWSPDLSADSWQPLGGWRIPAAGESAMFWLQNPQSVGTKGFYRVESRVVGE